MTVDYCRFGSGSAAGIRPASAVNGHAVLSEWNAGYVRVRAMTEFGTGPVDGTENGLESRLSLAN